MAIKSENITDTYKGKRETDAYVDFWRTAVAGEFDKCKWIARELLKDNKYESKTRVQIRDKWLVDWQYESHHSYVSRMIFANDFAFSRLVSEALTGHAVRAKAVATAPGLTPKYKEKFENNIDSSGSSLDMFKNQQFAEAVGVGKLTLYTNTVVKDNIDKVPTLIDISTDIIKRENVIDFAYDENGNYLFIKFNKPEMLVNGITKEVKKQIAIATLEEFAIAVEKKIIVGKSKWKVESTVANELKSIPAHDITCGSDVPIIHPIAKIQYNLFNLDSEWRSILRSQGGLNILAVQKGMDLDKLTSKSVLEYPVGATMQAHWVTYPSSGLEAHREYFKILTENMEKFSRLRSMGQAESGLKANIDFRETEAVITTIFDSIEKANTGALLDWYKYLKIDVGRDEAKVTIDKTKLNYKEISDELDDLLKMRALKFPEKWQQAIMKAFASKNINISDKEIDEGLDEIKKGIDAIKSSDKNLEPEEK